MTALLNQDDLPADYAQWLSGLKQRIQGARQRAALAVNRELILLYWQIGRDILQRQQAQGWGAKVIERLAQDLRAAFPEMKGFSLRNLKYMRAFSEAWSEEQIVQQAAAQLPWFHLCTLLDKVKIKIERDWYAAKAIENGWSRAILVMQIETCLYHLKLRCYVVVELKATAFKPEYAGQLSFYLSAVDTDIKAELDNPTIGLLLCKDHNRTVAEYALQGFDKPMGIANFQLMRAIPEKLADNLPTIESIEKELQWMQEQNIQNN